jgi:hypothetical protein
MGLVAKISLFSSASDPVSMPYIFTQMVSQDLNDHTQVY